jgi:hypothetical protein
MTASSLLTRLENRRSRRVLTAVAVIVACGLVGTGVIVASIPASDGVIHGCYTKSGGSIRVIDDGVTGCKASETAISWNQVGPTGAPGAPGAPGAAGAPGEPGPIGPSNGFLVDQRSSFGSQNLQGSSFVDIVTISLPAGSYVANGTAAIVGGAAFATAQCLIHSAGGDLSDSYQATVGGSGNSFGVVTITAAFSLAATTNVSLGCRSLGAVSSQPSALTAIQVGTLTTH